MANCEGASMANLWLKIRIWFKIILSVALTAFVALFVFKNSDYRAKFWLFGEIDKPILWVLGLTILFSVVGTILIGTAFKTMGQIRELRHKTQLANLQKDLTDRQAKAAMLQTKEKAAGKEAEKP
jgi:uncharacterized integral membrane protein